MSRTGAADPPLIATIARVTCAMPELAEVEWFRQQWDAGRGDEIVDVGVHTGKYVFRGTNMRVLQENLVGKKFLRSTRRAKQMLFKFSGHNWLGIHLGLTGKRTPNRAIFGRVNTIISCCIRQSARSSSPIRASSVTSVFITALMNRSGGNSTLPKLFRASSTRNFSTNS